MKANLTLATKCVPKPSLGTKLRKEMKPGRVGAARPTFSHRKPKTENRKPSLKGTVVGVPEKGENAGQDHVAFHQALQDQAGLQQPLTVNGQVPQGLQSADVE